MKTHLREIKKVKYLKKHLLEIEFSTGEVRVADLSPFVMETSFEKIRKLRNTKLFKEFKLTDGVINWYNGEIDINPYTIDQYFI